MIGSPLTGVTALIAMMVVEIPPTNKSKSKTNILGSSSISSESQGCRSVTQTVCQKRTNSDFKLSPQKQVRCFSRFSFKLVSLARNCNCCHLDSLTSNRVIFTNCSLDKLQLTQCRTVVLNCSRIRPSRRIFALLHNWGKLATKK